MAQVYLKKVRRYRVQITLSKESWELYQDNLAKARNLKAEIDFSRDFEPWFNRQNQVVKAELDRLLSETAQECSEVALQGKTNPVADNHDQLQTVEPIDDGEEESSTASIVGGTGDE